MNKEQIAENKGNPVSRDAIISSWCAAGVIPSSEIFFKTLSDGNGKFTAEEGQTWDFKDSWPFSYSDSYFGGIARLICAFSNTWGGLIIFGVDDKTRLGGRNKVFVNLDKLLLSFKQLTGSDALFLIQSYEFNGDEVTALFIRPRPKKVRPFRFLKGIDRYKQGIFWIRKRNEVLRATPDAYPVLFCRVSSADAHADAADVFGSLPANPATLKRFVGRIEVLDKLFSWLHSSDEPRCFLYGKGGSGKTSIAYEFAKLLREHGGDFALFGDRTVETVVFLSAKERMLQTATSTIEEVPNPDFFDEKSLYKSLLEYGRWVTNPSELSEFSLDELKNEVRSFFELSTCVVVIDDIDTLTTKGVEPGIDFLFRVLSRVESGSKVLYTLRNAPSHSLLNSVEVPGLERNGDYEEFVSACARQFSVTEPDPAFRDSTLASVSEQRPLVIESIIALCRTAGTYKNAEDLFRRNTGESIREYVFLREWNALPSDGTARMLLIALAEIGKSASFDDLVTVLRVEDTQVQDAVGAVREMFLQINESLGETRYSLAELTRQFVNSSKTTERHYNTLHQRIRNFKSYIHVTTPQVAKLITRVERTLNPREKGGHEVNSVQATWKLIDDPTLPASATQSPVFQSLRGYVACCFSPPRIIDARESFSDAVKMGYEPEYLQLKRWLHAERDNGKLEGGLFLATDIIIKGKRYSKKEKAFATQNKAIALFHRGIDRLATDPVDAEMDFRESLRLHLAVYKIDVDESHHWNDRSFDYVRKTAFKLFDMPLRQSEPWSAIDVVTWCVRLEGMYLAPLVDPIKGTLDKVVLSSTRPDIALRCSGRMKLLVQSTNELTWTYDPGAGRDFSKYVDAINLSLIERARRTERK